MTNSSPRARPVAPRGGRGRGRRGGHRRRRIRGGARARKTMTGQVASPSSTARSPILRSARSAMIRRRLRWRARPAHARQAGGCSTRTGSYQRLHRRRASSRVWTTRTIPNSTRWRDEPPRPRRNAEAGLRAPAPRPKAAKKASQEPARAPVRFELPRARSPRRAQGLRARKPRSIRRPSNRMPGCSKACSTISASAARSSMSAPVRW